MRPLALILALASICLAGYWLARPDACDGILCPQSVFLDRAAREADPARRIDILRTATARDPGNPYRWADLGEAYLDAAGHARAAPLFEKAEALGSHIPPILIRVANYHLVGGRSSEALRRTARILQLIEEYDAAVFAIYDRFGIGPDRVLDTGVPAEPRIARAYLRSLIAMDRPDHATAAWNWMRTRRLADDPVTGDYASYLVRIRRRQQAAEVWKSRTHADHKRYLLENNIDNPDFRELLNDPRCPLGWTVDKVDGVDAARESSAGPDGRSALHLRFAGASNIDYRQTFQSAWVTPGVWRLRALVKTRDLTTNQGVGIRVFDADDGTRLGMLTGNITGTRDWTPVEVVFAVGPLTSLLRVEVARVPSEKFDNRIRGDAWITGVILQRAAAHEPLSPNR